MKEKKIIELNSLNITFSEFETIIWNVTQIDEIKNRNYLFNVTLHNEEVPLELINYLSKQTHVDPIFKINRWVSSNTLDNKKAYDTAIFWLKVFLNENVSSSFPTLEENVEFLNNLRNISPGTYSKLIKNALNF